MNINSNNNIKNDIDANKSLAVNCKSYKMKVFLLNQFTLVDTFCLIWC